VTPFVEGHGSVNQNLSLLLLQQFYTHFLRNKLSPSQISLYSKSKQRRVGYYSYFVLPNNNKKLTEHVFFTLLEVSLPTVVLILFNTTCCCEKKEEKHNVSF